MAVIGYGSQGFAQSSNMRDQGLNVVIGVRKDGASWREAQNNGWVPGQNLFEIEDAISRGSIIMNLLSDAAQSQTWPTIKPLLTKDKVPEFLIKYSAVFFLFSNFYFTFLQLHPHFLPIFFPLGIACNNHL